MLKSGRLGNQLLRFLHLLAWVIDNDHSITICNVNFWPYAALFEHWKDNPYCNYPAKANQRQLPDVIYKYLCGYSHRSNQAPAKQEVTENNPKQAQLRKRHHMLHELIALVPGCASIRTERIFKNIEKVVQQVNLDNKETTESIKNNKFTLIGGWHVSAWSALQENETRARDLFTIHPLYRQAPLDLISYIREKHNLVVGVLIRQGDYRAWRGGHHFHTVQQYFEYMQLVRDLYPTIDVAFLVVSDEVIETKDSDNLNVYLGPGSRTGPGHPIENLLALSLCDLILSAPSTFSALAGFLGEVPLLPISSGPTQNLHTVPLINTLFDARHHAEFNEAVK